MSAYYVDGYLTETVGMPEKVAWAIEVLKELWPHDDGPGHIVYADWNFRDSDIEWCLGEIERGETYSDYPPDHPIFVATAALLRWLLEIPESERDEWERYP